MLADSGTIRRLKSLACALLRTHVVFVASDIFHGIRIARGDHLIGTEIASGTSREYVACGILTE